MKKTLTRLVYASTALLVWHTLPAQQTATTTPPSAADEAEIELEEFRINDMRSFSDVAIPDKTPVSFTELTKEAISTELGSRDIPLLLNTTPSVYSTTDGGAAGDARVNVRGFNQRNVSILINGVPTNDIENGWLYWSNWDGLGDVTSSIQMQRGLSNVTLPTPSIGGTMNIITDPAASHAGGSFKTEFGSDNFKKVTAVYSTGMLADRVAFTVGAVYKEGDGAPRGAWTEGYGYYLGSSLKLNKANRLELFVIGAPQQHGQRRFASNIAAYDVGFARSKFGYTDAQLYSLGSGANAGAIRQGPVGAGHRFNPNYAPVSSTYTGKQWYWGGLHNREDASSMNESVNYFHKPQANLNWHSRLSERAKLATVLYYSGGDGGGSGTLNNGSSSAAFARYSNTTPLYGSNINWDGTIASNAGAVAANGSAKTAGRSLGILRNSVNEQDQFGIVSKLTFDASDTLKVTTGVDWRTAEIDHFREVRDLLGGNYYLPTSAQASEFWASGTSTQLGLGDKVDYFNTNTVDWLGLFVQGQYESGPITAFAVYGYSAIEYGYVDHFRRASAGSAEKFKLNSPTIDGHQVKGGLQYAINDQLRVYGNLGFVSKAPVFDGAINDVTGVKLDPQNEKFSSIEVGVRFETSDRKANISAGLYHTRWRDRTISAVSEQANTITYQRGVNSNYSGLEVEGAWKPMELVRFDVAASIGDWYHSDDSQFEIFDISTGQPITTSNRLYLKDLKIGDAPQSQIAYAATLYPLKGLSVKLQGRWYDRYWADYDPTTRTTEADRGQAWRIPSYSIYDVVINYNLPFNFERTRISIFASAFNVFDKTYVADATDNSAFEAVGLNLAPSHSAQRAEVFLGAPFVLNAGVKVSF